MNTYEGPRIGYDPEGQAIAVNALREENLVARLPFTFEHLDMVDDEGQSWAVVHGTFRASPFQLYIGAIRLLVDDNCDINGFDKLSLGSTLMIELGLANVGRGNIEKPISRILNGENVLYLCPQISGDSEPSSE